MITNETILRLAIALAVGLLIGLERGWHERAAEEGMRVAGVRTFALIGLLVGFTGLLGAETELAVKGAMTMVIGRWWLAVRVAVPLALAAAAGLLVAWNGSASAGAGASGL